MYNIDVRFSRSVAVWGEEAAEKLAQSHVALFGLGGVGSFAAEALARAGVGELTIVDYDVVTTTNINRQLLALTDTVGQAKTEVMTKRLLGINPNLKLHPIREFYNPQESDGFIRSHGFNFDYVLDAIDYVAGKIGLVRECTACGVPLITCLGMGNKVNPTLVEVTDIFATKNDPLARVMRRRLRECGVKKLKVVYSPELPRRVNITEDGRKVPGSTPFVPSVAGITMAAEAVKDLI